MSVFDGFRFRSVSSPIHKLDPRVKFIYVCAAFVLAVMFNEIIPLLLLFAIQIPFLLIARVQREWIRSMKGASFLSFIIFITNLISMYLYTGRSWSITIVEQSLGNTFRFIVLVESFSTFFLTTSPDHLALALEQSRVPFELCFAFTTAIRFVPVLSEEAQTIMDAQKARGLELEGGNFLKRIKNYVPILIPLIVNSIRRSLQLAEAMESRAWGASEKRTNLYTLKMRRGDYCLILISSLILVLGIYARWFLSIPSITALLKT